MTQIAPRLFSRIFLVLFLCAFTHGTYIGPCDQITCAEAFSVTRAMISTYTGPLFQLWNGTTTLDIGQGPGRKADMTTWSAFCSGVAANCKISKIYAQIHTTSNDLIPDTLSDWPTAHCQTGGPYVCASIFEIEPSTGLPILDNTTSTQTSKYFIASDAAATGVTGGQNDQAVIYVGQSVASTACCGIFGITHVWSGADTKGTDFTAAAFNGNLFGTTCPAGSFCIGLDEESVQDIGAYSGSTNYIISVFTWTNSTLTLTAYMNNNLIFSVSPPAANGVNGPLNPGNHIHVGGGGDMSPAFMKMREGILVNSALTPAQITAVTNNAKGFYSPLFFP